MSFSSDRRPLNKLPDNRSYESFEYRGCNASKKSKCEYTKSENSEPEVATNNQGSVLLTERSLNLEEQRPLYHKNNKENRIGSCLDGYASEKKYKNGEYQSDPCKKVKQALNDFKETYKKILGEHKFIPKKHIKASFSLLVEAANELKKQNKWVNTEEHSTGPVPGIEIGDWFNYRVELAVVGLHRQYFMGIDSVNINGKIYATSVVDSARYLKEMEYSDVLIYSGQGGNPSVSCRKIEDQKLKLGNLALKNSMMVKSPVRVVRIYPFSKNSGPESLCTERKMYIYDGLYYVTDCWQEIGKYGKLVFMFRLEKQKGQPKLAPISMIQSRKSRKPNVLHKNCIVEDISCGKEKISMCAINSIDGDKLPFFNYTKDMIYPELHDFSMPRGCDCKNGCSDSKQCSCMVKNDGEFPFNNDGAIIKAKQVIYECGPLCKCSSSCKNRISQFGVQYKLEVFKNESRWGVRCPSYITARTFICEYAGEVVPNDDTNNWVGRDKYLIDIGVQHKKEKFMIDATHFGNVARFIKHSCEPNLFVQHVLYDHGDERTPHIMLFARKNIRPLEELTCDFNFKMGQSRKG